MSDTDKTSAKLIATTRSSKAGAAAEKAETKAVTKKVVKKAVTKKAAAKTSAAKSKTAAKKPAGAFTHGQRVWPD